jgi:NhaP-type Na+/H+ or K+/H+ antiporter
VKALLDMHAYWILLVGLLLVLMAFVGSAMDKLPMTPGLIYLLIGYALGPGGFDLVDFNPVRHAKAFEVLAEVVVAVSLFVVGLKLRVDLGDPIWKLPVRLATISMMIAIALVALLGVYGFGMSWGAAVLLGAILAPTDPVLASDVQVRHADDRDRTRFSLTGEGGLNDGTAFPFVMLGLGLLGLHNLGEWGVRWLLVDGIWAVAAGIAIGWYSGKAVGWAVLYLRREFNAGHEWEEFLALGLMGASYGLASLAHSYAFLAVLAAGLALRRVETEKTPSPPAAQSGRGHEPAAGDGVKATPEAYMVRTVLGFNQSLERIGELVVVLVLGVCMSTLEFDRQGMVVALLLFVLIRPAATLVGLIGCNYSWREFQLISWFGIRGAGSFYYLMFVIAAGVPHVISQKLMTIVLTVVSISIVVHGISATPLMALAARHQKRRS